MLESLLGIRLMLYVGNTIPLPAPAEVLSSFISAQVTNDSAQGDGFQLTFSLTKGPAFDYTILQSGALDLFNRVVIAVVIGVLPEVLIDGIITHHQLAPSNEPGKSTLTVTGKDVSIMLDLEEKNQPYPNQPDWLIVSQLLTAYAQYGLIPAPTPTADIPLEIQRVTRQQDTDFRFITTLAERNGYVFYIEPVTLGVNTAYWGPENRLSIPQPALSVDMGSSTNVSQLSFSADALAPVETKGTMVEPITKTAIPVPSLPPLKIPPLALSQIPAKRKTLLRDTANQGIASAAAAAISASTRAPDPVNGMGEIDCIKYGHVLRARKLVGVRGVGYTYDGNYYVRSVTHTITRGQYKQQFTISREGTGAMLPVVIP